MDVEQEQPRDIVDQAASETNTKENNEAVYDSEQHLGRKSNRSKRIVERFAQPSPAKPKTSSNDEATGSGVPLSENYKTIKALDKLKSDDESLKRLHMILYGSVGTQSMRKREVRKWNGTDDSAKRETITRVLELTKSSATLKDICSILGLSKTGPVEGRRSVIAEYLFKPTASKKAKKPSGGKKQKPAKKPRVDSTGVETFMDFINRRAPQVEAETGLTPSQVTALLAREWKHMQSKPTSKANTSKANTSKEDTSDSSSESGNESSSDSGSDSSDSSSVSSD